MSCDVNAPGCTKTTTHIISVTDRTSKDAFVWDACDHCTAAVTRAICDLNAFNEHTQMWADEFGFHSHE